MSLFREETDRNLLPYEGIVQYFGPILSKDSSDDYLKILLKDIPWKNDEAIIFGKHIITKRMVAWFGDSDYEYTYSNTTKKALPWTKELSDLKSLAEKITETKFNSCLLNLYNDGEEGMAWHSDDEKALGKNSTIASLSFGAERKFYFKHKSTKEQISLILEHGSLLLMKGAQESWLHSLPKTKSVKQPRINLTFRTMRY
ncbi:alpha-ketoglutarate-dependent dioxygenase AlkB [Leptospira hartskeerlii]|uniref:Alpha-ketoglutarate-dependent dioxygenase AlkB n=1 Tax=Leptospira hartskeerlii TaxID=2023177 RepID=A0A2M9XGK3_9LEPT|nr:alpha-ketoglutarate-dependent dioxygenase AlkB [Leptospira hartskeerlii]PJZ26769.1 alpha-ketoglutarate-dependent dioxygenase AlkB [Leptospira hartskeerlii]PJZ34749.1 alpha-ketoglutarate-dependent dioxygenase AlkB [Leptospira hartskeerlii]